MDISRKGEMELIGHEAIVQTRYRDSKGIWTLGVGHTFAAGPPNPAEFTGTLSIPDVFELFRKDLQTYIRAVDTAVKVPISQTQFDALVSWHFNTGAVRKASLVIALNKGNIAAAGDGLMAWVHPPELLGRRSKEHLLFEKGIYSNHGMATVYPASKTGVVQWSKGKRIDLNKELTS